MKDANVLRIRNHGNSYTLAFQMETVQLCNITAVIRDRNILTVKMYEIWPLSWRRRPLSPNLEAKAHFSLGSIIIQISVSRPF